MQEVAHAGEDHGHLAFIGGDDFFVFDGAAGPDGCGRNDGSEQQIDTSDRPSPRSHAPIAPPVRATRPRPPGVLVPTGARTSESAAGRQRMREQSNSAMPQAGDLRGGGGDSKSRASRVSGVLRSRRPALPFLPIGDQTGFHGIAAEVANRLFFVFEIARAGVPAVRLPEGAAASEQSVGLHTVECAATSCRPLPSFRAAASLQTPVPWLPSLSRRWDSSPSRARRGRRA